MFKKMFGHKIDAKEIKKLRECLQHNPILGWFKEAELNYLLSLGELRTAKAGEVVFDGVEEKQGFIVVQGVVEMRKKGQIGDQDHAEAARKEAASKALDRKIASATLMRHPNSASSPEPIRKNVSADLTTKLSTEGTAKNLSKLNINPGNSGNNSVARAMTDRFGELITNFGTGECLNFLSLVGVRNVVCYIASADQATHHAPEDVTLWTIDAKGWDKFIKKHPQKGDYYLRLWNFPINAFLKHFPFFDASKMPKECLDIVYLMLHYRQFASNEVIFSEDEPTDPADTMIYYIVDGTVSETQRIPDEMRTSTIATHRDDSVFGETAFVIEQPRNTSCKATGEKGALCVAMAKRDFLFLLYSYTALRDLYSNPGKTKLTQFCISSQFRLFEALPIETYPVMIRNCEYQILKRGEIVFNEGDTGDAFYIIVFGILDVIVKGVAVTSMRAGRFFGEIALVTEQPRTATIRAQDNAILLKLTKEQFEVSFSNSPQFLSDFQIKLAPKNCELKHILYHPVGFECFKQQMQVEHSEENIEFWSDCKKYKEILKEIANYSSTDQIVAPPSAQKKRAGTISTSSTASSVSGRNEARLKKDLAGMADKIYKTYLAGSASLPVNLKGSTKKQLVAEYNDGSLASVSDSSSGNTGNTGESASLDRAMLEIFNLMERDSFARFKRGQLFADFLASLGAYDGVDDMKNTILKLNPDE